MLFLKAFGMIVLTLLLMLRPKRRYRPLLTEALLPRRRRDIARGYTGRDMLPADTDEPGSSPISHALTRVPVAADGTWFGPHLERAGKFQVGDKGSERSFESFERALAFLSAQPTARWRRPNSNGNWGIVTAVRWARVDELSASTSDPARSTP